ncbi:MAG TPA: IS481 family transposase [Isosphaeraceae bacterium]|nr:IS481 family transposase [Isosphaeraceae bacterium]
MPELRLALIHAVRSAGLSVAEAARRFGVSRKAAFKWLARHDAEPERPPADRSRRPLRSPGRTPEDVERLVLEARGRWGWGPRKLRALLARAGHPAPPARTIAAILRRHGRTRPAPAEPGPPPQRFERTRPNELWQLDFKGPLEVARRKVTPLSVLDDHSRYLLCLRPCADMTFATVPAALWELFGDVGLPEALLCDNASSTAKNSGVGLTSFEAWLIRLGIRPAHGRPYHPQTQGKVERFHGTLEAELWPQVRRDTPEHFSADLEAWRPVSNAVRPHEALGDEPPVCRWRPSDRRRPDRVPEATLPGRCGGAAGRPGWGRPLPGRADHGGPGPGWRAGAGGGACRPGRGGLLHVPGPLPVGGGPEA